MLVDTGKRIPWTFTGQTVSTAFSLPLEEILTRELKVTYEARRESLFRPVLPALEDPALQRHGRRGPPSISEAAGRLWLCGQQQCVPDLCWRICTERQIDLEPRQI